MTGFRGERRTRIFTPGLSEVPRPPSILARPTAGGSTHPAPPARSNSALADPEGTPYSPEGRWDSRTTLSAASSLSSRPRARYVSVCRAGGTRRT
jgi:hypothetical protein